MCENVCLFHGDNVPIMQSWGRNVQVDMVVTSPPYDAIRRGCEAFLPDTLRLIRRLRRRVKENGIVAWNIANQTQDFAESCTAFDHVEAFRREGFRLTQTLIY